MYTKIAVIGATGKAGKHVTQALALAGYSLRLLLRDPQKYGNVIARDSIVRGDAGNYEDIVHLLQGCQAVVSTLGQPQGGSPIFSQTTGNIVRAMEAAGLRRYIAVTGLSIDTPFDKKGPQAAQASEYMRRTFPSIIADKQEEYAVLSRSNSDWTLIRVPLIIQTDTRTVTRYPAGGRCYIGRLLSGR